MTFKQLKELYIAQHIESTDTNIATCME